LHLLILPTGVRRILGSFDDVFVKNVFSISWHTHDQPLRINNPKAKILPKSYICCTEFGNAQFKALESPADWDYHELMKGHDVMITAPKELVRLLEMLENK
jgi:hypothetical protein